MHTALTAVLTCLLVFPTTAADAKGKAPNKLRIAVTDFTNATSDPKLDPLGKGLASMVTTDMAYVPEFELVERSRLGDIKAELKLQKGKGFDKKTAVKAGKLLGASHIVTGSFQVTGDTMRLDVRLLTVKGAKVLLAKEVTGERDAFFELEKDLVKKLIAAVGQKIAPRVRARIAKIHTADFAAFEKFSQGLAAFDAKRYQDAIAAMQAASAQDADFKLAVLTLGKYQELIAKLDAKVDAARVYEEEQFKLKKAKAASKNAELAQKLMALARGKDTIKMKVKGISKDKANLLVRLVALDVLVSGYRGSFADLYRMEDKFAMKRTADTLVQEYFLKAVDVWPLARFAPSGYGAPVFAPTGKFKNNFFATMRQRLFRTPYVWNSGKYPRQAATVAEAMMMDTRQHAALLERMLTIIEKRVGAKNESQKKQLHEWYFDLGELLAKVPDPDASTRVLMKLSARSKDSRLLDKIAKQVKKNRDMAAALAVKGPARAYREEYFRTGGYSSSMIKKAVALFPDSGDLTEEGRRALNLRVRKIRKYGLPNINVGQTPIWVLQGLMDITTDRRVDRRRANALRYYPSGGRPSCGSGSPGCGSELIAITGPVPAQSFKASFALDFTPAKDFYRPESRKRKPAAAGARPTVGFLFGVRDVWVPAVDRKRGAKEHRPFKGFRLAFGPSGVELASVVDDKAGYGLKLAPTSLKRWNTPVPKRAKVKVRVQGKKLTFTLNGKSFAYTLPSAVRGWRGLHTYDDGYVEIGSLVVK